LIGRQDESDASLIHIVRYINAENSIAKILPALDLQSNACRRMERLATKTLPLIPDNARIEEQGRANLEKPKTHKGEHSVLEVH
jgi:hypothetical protein